MSPCSSELSVLTGVGGSVSSAGVATVSGPAGACFSGRFPVQLARCPYRLVTSASQSGQTSFGSPGSCSAHSAVCLSN